MKKSEFVKGMVYFISFSLLFIVILYSLINSNYVIDEEEIVYDYDYWDHMPITYFLQDSCVGPIVPRIYLAFEIIENETGGEINFVENENADILIICYSFNNVRYLENEDVTLYTFGSTKNVNDGKKIMSSKVEFWNVGENKRPSSCNNYPRLEIHEILHALGFEHNLENKYSIMWPSENGQCIGENKNPITINNRTFIPEDKIDGEIIEILKEIY